MAVKVSIDDMRKNGDSARTYQWNMSITGGGSLTGAGSDLINIRCESADQPTPTNSIIEINTRAFTTVEVGGVSWNPITFTVIETVNYSIIKNLVSTSKGQFDWNTGKQGSKFSTTATTSTASSIGMVIKLDLLQLDNETPGGTWTLNGAVLEAFNPPQLNNDKAGYWGGFSFTVRYDFASFS